MDPDYQSQFAQQQYANLLQAVQGMDAGAAEHQHHAAAAGSVNGAQVRVWACSAAHARVVGGQGSTVYPTSICSARETASWRGDMCTTVGPVGHGARSPHSATPRTRMHFNSAPTWL